jgi:hypothetical protein
MRKLFLIAIVLMTLPPAAAFARGVAVFDQTGFLYQVEC